MNEGWTKTEREPIEDRSRSYRGAIESRTHPEDIPKENKATQYAKNTHKTLIYHHNRFYEGVMLYFIVSPVTTPQHSRMGCPSRVGVVENVIIRYCFWFSTFISIIVWRTKSIKSCKPSPKNTLHFYWWQRNYNRQSYDYNNSVKCY